MLMNFYQIFLLLSIILIRMFCDFLCIKFQGYYCRVFRLFHMEGYLKLSRQLDLLKGICYYIIYYVYSSNIWLSTIDIKLYTLIIHQNLRITGILPMSLSIKNLNVYTTGIQNVSMSLNSLVEYFTLLENRAC